MADTTRIHFWNYIINNEGEPLQNVEVKFYLNDDPTTEANIFLSSTALTYTNTSNANIKTDKNGYFEFWIGKQWENGGYPNTQEFRLEWYRAGTRPGVLENINPWPNAFSWENTNSSTDVNDRNKFISDYYGNKWYEHYNQIVPSASPHNLDAVDYESGCDNNIYNKVVSNKFLNDILTFSSSTSSANLSGHGVREYQENITSWTPSSGIFYKDISYTNIKNENITAQIVKLSNKKVIEPKRIHKLSASSLRVFVESEVDVNINIQGSSSSSSSSISSSSFSSSSSSLSSSSLSSSSSFSYTPGERGIFGGGFDSPTTFDVIDYITINSIGNAIDFGDLTVARQRLAANSNGTNERGVFGGGVASNVIDYITINSIGNAIDFGDLTVARQALGSTSNGTNERGIFGGGTTGTSSDVIDYITINSIGNAIDFGNLTLDRAGLAANSNGTNERGVFGGGSGALFVYNVIDYITINSIGNAIDFGDLTLSRDGIASTSNLINERGTFSGGASGGVFHDIIDYITINSIGNAVDFGDLTVARFLLAGTSNGTNERGVFGGGNSGTVQVDTIDYITINSIGNAIDFGNLTLVGRQYLSSNSDS